MPSVSLHELISALSGAVVQAQDAVQQHQLMLLGQFFDETGAPKTVSITVPNPSQNAPAPAGTGSVQIADLTVPVLNGSRNGPWQAVPPSPQP